MEEEKMTKKKERNNYQSFIFFKTEYTRRERLRRKKNSKNSLHFLKGEMKVRRSLKAASKIGAQRTEY